MAYMNQEIKKQKEFNIKKILKSFNLKGTLSVRNHSTLVLTIKKGQLDFVGEYKEAYSSARDTPIMVSRYNYRNVHSKKIVEFLDEIFKELNYGNWNNSRPEVDHFDIGWYVEVNVGTWKSPYQMVRSQN